VLLAEGQRGNLRRHHARQVQENETAVLAEEAYTNPFGE